MPILTITTGPQRGTTFELANRPLSLGRDPTRDIQIIDPKVSRKHAIVRPVSGNHVISPMRSTNPMLINGLEATGETILAQDDKLTLGDTVMVFSETHGGEYTNAVHHRKVAHRNAREANTIM